MLNTVHYQRGLSMIEVMIAVVIASILMMLGANSYSTWIQNQQTRVAAEAILNGIQMARAEAVKRNASVEIELCALPSSSWEIEAASAVATAASIGVSLACPSAPQEDGRERVQERAAAEGSRNATVSVTPNTATILTFNSMGRVIVNPDLSPSITQVDVSNPKGDRPLRITISTGGSVRMCDPSATLAANDPRKC